ncbi:MAG: hypothetical protein Q8K92_15755 [Leadbetterella sp.]|nr:hypothetical protein [Leadbetterella sp.]
MITTLLAASLMLSCNPKEILEPTDSNIMIIDGDTVKVRNDKAQGNFGVNKSRWNFRILYGDTILKYSPLNISFSTKKVNIEKIKNNVDPDLKGKPFRMIVVGDGVAAGVRDGGYFNEGLETSFPNLVAKQMGIDFKQPKFEPSDFNGFGRAIYTNKNYTGGPVPKFVEVSNNTGYTKKDDMGNFELKPYIGGRVDNFASIGSLNYDVEIDTKMHPGLSRLKGNQKISPIDLYLKEKFDFIIICDNVGMLRNNQPSFSHDINFPNGFEGYKNIITRSSGQPQYSSRLNFLLKIKERKEVRGVMFTAPNFMKLPYFNWVTVDEVKNILNLYGKSNLFDIYSIKKILPTPKIDSLVGKNVNMNLKPFISENKKIDIFNASQNDEFNVLSSIGNSNSETRNVAKSLNFALVDLFSVYEAVFAGKYLTHDGIIANVENFFSKDGMSPSAFGQVIIANETIKTINAHYGLDIELLPTRPFLLK